MPEKPREFIPSRMPLVADYHRPFIARFLKILIGGYFAFLGANFFIGGISMVKTSLLPSLLFLTLGTALFLWGFTWAIKGITEKHPAKKEKMKK